MKDKVRKWIQDARYRIQDTDLLASGLFTVSRENLCNLWL